MTEFNIDNLTPEQQQLFEERKFMLRIKMAKDRRAQLAHIITCQDCQKEYTLRLKNNKPLTYEEINFMLILEGWFVANKGYICKECDDASTQAIVNFIRGNETRIVDAGE